MEVARLDCPHCKRKLISRTSGWRYTLDPPLRICPYCNGEYLMPCTYEWSIAGPLGKFFYCFLANGRCALLPMILVEFANGNPKSALFWTTIWITICIFNLTVLDRKKIKSSYERTKNNSEYIQKLSDMGYARIAYRLDPYYK